MPWLAVPWKDDQLRSVLGRKFQVLAQLILQILIAEQDPS